MKLFAHFILLGQHLLLLFCPPSFFFQAMHPQKFRLVLQNRPLFFPNQRSTPWLLRVTPLPNMHENVMVCLEAICRARKFKPQHKNREVPTTRATFMASLARQLKKLAQTALMYTGNTLGKQPLCTHLFKKKTKKNCGFRFLMKCACIISERNI